MKALTVRQYRLRRNLSLNWFDDWQACEEIDVLDRAFNGAKLAVFLNTVGKNLPVFAVIPASSRSYC